MERDNSAISLTGVKPVGARDSHGQRLPVLWKARSEWYELEARRTKQGIL